MDIGLRAVLAQQALIAAVSIAGYALLQDQAAAQASAFGAVAALVMSALLAFKIKHLNKRLGQNKVVSVGTVMLGFAPRLLLVLVFFWLGLSILGFAPLPMIVTFALVHLGYLFNVVSHI